MRKLLMTTATLLALATAASADTVKLPKEYLGSWCITHVIKSLGQHTIEHERCDIGPERTFINPNSLDSFASPVGECMRLLKGERAQLETFHGKRYYTYFMTYQCRGGTLSVELSLEGGSSLVIWIKQ